MALINNIYVFVESEDVSRDVAVSSHPVEEGIDLTDHVSRSALKISLTGEIVGEGYEDDLRSLENLQKTGELVHYIGLYILQNAIITKLSTSHTARIRGGCSVSVELQEIRIATSPFEKGEVFAGEQQIKYASTAPQQKTHTVKSGDTLWGLAKSYLGSGSSFPKIFDLNRDILSDPNKIKIGQVLKIP